MDKSVTASLVQTVCQAFFIITVTVFSLSWLFTKLKKYYTRTYADLPRTDEVIEDEHHRYQQAEHRNKMQEEFDYKASDYKERILKPREEAKRMKKEKDYRKFLGPTWQSEGTVLGGDALQSGDDDDDGVEDVSEGRLAARKRKVPEQINQVVAEKVAAAAATKLKVKRIIKLADEPDMSEDGVISVMLRTPIGTICQRRFYASDTVQCLLDFITTQGFSQRRYTICSSFPRIILENRNACLSEYNFGKRVALNIEERD